MPETSPQNSILLLHGYKQLLHKELRIYAAAPIVINIIIFSIAILSISGFIEQLQTYINSFGNFASGFLSFLNYIISAIAWLAAPVIYISCSIVFFYFFSSFTQFFAAPFNAILSEKVEKLYNLEQASEINTLSFWEVTKNTIPRELYKFYKSIKWLLLMLILLFIPMVNLIVPLIGAWLLAIDYLDYPADNRGWSFKESLNIISKKPLKHLLFGFSIYLATLIPIVNFFVVPAAVIAGTLLWHETKNHSA